MESLPRPFNRRHSSSLALSSKLPNANSCSAKNAYEGVFSGAPKSRIPTHSSRIEDYSEIFGGSQASSVPILDLSALDEARVSGDARRGSKLDYSQIFGGFRDEEVSVSYEEMTARPKGAKNPHKARISGRIESPSVGPERDTKESPCDTPALLNRYKEEVLQYAKAPSPSFEGIKQFNTPCHKTSQRSKDGTNGATLITHLGAVPEFICFLDKNHHLRKAEGDKPVPPAKVDAKSLPKVDPKLTKKQNFDGIGNLKSQTSWDKFYSVDKPFKENENSLKTDSYKTSSRSSPPANKSEPKWSMDSKFKVPATDASRAGPGDSLSDEEVDENSAAAVSAAALRKALEKAQASILLAKELMKRKKDGRRKFPRPSSKDGLDIKKRREDKVIIEASKPRVKIAKEICESTDSVLQVSTKSERGKAWGRGKVAPDIKGSQEISVVEEIVVETNRKRLESSEDCEALSQFSELADTCEHRTATLGCKHADGSNNIMLSTDAHECRRKEMDTGEEILEQLDGNDEEVDGAQELMDTHEFKREEVETSGEILDRLDGSGKKVDVHQEPEDLEGKLTADKVAQDWEQHVYRLGTAQEAHQQEEIKKEGAAWEDEETEKQRASSGQEKYEQKLEDALEPNQNKEFDYQESMANNDVGLDEELACMENEKQEKDFEIEHKNKSLKDVHEEDESAISREEICKQEKNDATIEAAHVWVDSEEASKVENNEKRDNDGHMGEDNDEMLDKIHKLEINNKSDGEGSKEQEEDSDDWGGKEKILAEAGEYEETESINKETEGNGTSKVNQEAVKVAMDIDITTDACQQDACERVSKSGEAYAHKESDKYLDVEDNERISDVTQSSCEFQEDENGLEAVEVAHELHKETEGNGRAKDNQEAVKEAMDIGVTTDACEQDAGERVGKSGEAYAHERNGNYLNVEDNERTSNVTQSSCEFLEDENGLEAVVLAHELGERERCKTGDLDGDATELIEIKNKKQDATEALLFNANPANISSGDMDFGPEQTDQTEKDSELASNSGSGIKISVRASGECDKKVEEKSSLDLEETKSDSDTAVEKRQWVEIGKKNGASQLPSMFKGREKMVRIDEEVKNSQITETNEENFNKFSTVEDNKVKGTAQKEVEVEKDHLRKNIEGNKRERELKKDRIVVERAIRESHERALVEAREKTERAAVERATAEARQRAMAETREKFEKASAATKSSSEKASLAAKRKAERVAVERAIAEARERALEKALSHSATFGARAKAESYVADRFSALSREIETKQSFPSSDNQKSDGTHGESVQRCKARLERNQRTMERAAKALAEKNRRDLVALKEQAQRNRLAEILDADVKRWSSGKEGNLRALLSTLQYILGPDSGWQSISLTDMITTDAVKKAYRKATLHVHPDKLQQRGASIHQKYICEKVFDLLKAAWNKLKSEER